MSASTFPHYISMNVVSKILKLLRDPVGVVKRRLLSLSERFRFRTGTDYNAGEYWKYRHQKFGFDLRGVGDISKTHEENVRLLDQGARVFLDVCHEAGVNFSTSRALDIGCGTGHFAEILNQKSVSQYLGIDIADTLFEGLRSQLPGFRFSQVDISTQQISGTYDLIIAMDVLQHITDDYKFAYAIENIKAHLSEDGVVVISINLGENERPSFYMVKRPLKTFQKMFPGFVISEPKPYADSHVFSIKRIEN
jgi:2-polyprenyl-3-methyl-5-hydroxy-6-metoxy-1,4-benzoquinol methylase